jgi:hypothetical protein
MSSPSSLGFQSIGHDADRVHRGSSLAFQSIGHDADRVHRGCFVRELVEIDRFRAAHRREAQLLDAADDHHRDEVRIAVAHVASLLCAHEVALEDRDQRVVDLAEDLLDLRIGAAAASRT